MARWTHVPNLLGAKRKEESLKSENGHLHGGGIVGVGEVSTERVEAKKKADGE
jgi:hypothetical protein